MKTNIFIIILFFLSTVIIAQNTTSSNVGDFKVHDTSHVSISVKADSSKAIQNQSGSFKVKNKNADNTSSSSQSGTFKVKNKNNVNKSASSQTGSFEVKGENKSEEVPDISNIGSFIPAGEFIKSGVTSLNLNINSSNLRACDVCNGTGKIGITVKCPDCGALGYKICGKCDIHGKVQCPKCLGIKTEPCTMCRGTGEMTETLYVLENATSLLLGGKPVEKQKVVCTRCDGRRVIPCEKCEGSGVIDCPHCGGEHQVKCTSCDGKGKTTEYQTCPKCKGLKIIYYPN